MLDPSNKLYDSIRMEGQTLNQDPAPPAESPPSRTWGNLARTMRNKALYPTARAIRSGVEACVGVGCSGLRSGVARLRYMKSFSPGLTIQDSDLTLARAQTAANHPTNIASNITDFATQLSEQLSDKILYINEENINLELFKSLAEGEFSSQIKGLYLLHYASMGAERLNEIDMIHPSTATRILIDIHYMNPDDISYEGRIYSDSELQDRLDTNQRRALRERRPIQKKLIRGRNAEHVARAEAAQGLLGLRGGRRTRKYSVKRKASRKSRNVKYQS